MQEEHQAKSRPDRNESRRTTKNKMFGDDAFGNPV